MDIEFDPNKRELTLQARGLDFADAGALFSGPTVTREDTRQDYGETRWITMGLLDDRPVVVVWTARGTARRIISMRYAHDDEAKSSASPWVDPDDAPLLGDEFFEQGTWRVGEQEVTPEEAKAIIAKRGRPKSDAAKVPVKLRLDPDVLAVLRATGPGWQTRVNRILRERFAL